ncbi:MAG TPA: LCP family protein [Candidatus Dorea intestinavium]|nr:LCP family protein [Candidatus Dorea intestinavium]
MSNKKKYHRGRREEKKPHLSNAAKRKLEQEKKQSKGLGQFIGKVICIIQLMVTIGFGILLWHSGLMPNKYLIPILVALFVLFGITFGLQFLRNKGYIVGIILSVIISLLLSYGIYSLSSANKFLKDVSGAKYKTDNMVAVVLTDDPAKSIEDAKDYTFGTQTTTDIENTKKMVKEMEKELGSAITIKEYDNIQELGAAILNKEVDSGIYNESMSGILQETVEGYDGATRVLYQYGIHTEVEEQQPADVTKPFSIFISGIDVSGPISTNSRSDVNIIMTVNPQTKKILLTTTPRDYYVTIPEVSGSARDKLTHAGIYGVDASIRTLENLYGIDIAYYARVNFDSVIKIVDVVGGVDVNSEEAFTTTIDGYNIQQGMNHLNGKQTLAFVRERYNVAGGDNQRGLNQQKVITAILQKMMTPSMIVQVDSLLSSVEGSFETNMTHEEMQKLIKTQINSGLDFDIQSVAATGTGGSDVCFSTGTQPLYVTYPDENSINEIKAQLNEIIGNN